MKHFCFKRRKERKKEDTLIGRTDLREMYSPIRRKNRETIITPEGFPQKLSSSGKKMDRKKREKKRGRRRRRRRWQ